MEKHQTFSPPSWTLRDAAEDGISTTTLTHSLCAQHTWEDCRKPEGRGELSTSPLHLTGEPGRGCTCSDLPSTALRPGAQLSNTIKVSGKNESWGLKRIIIEGAQRGGFRDSKVVCHWVLIPGKAGAGDARSKKPRNMRHFCMESKLQTLI